MNIRRLVILLALTLSLVLASEEETCEKKDENGDCGCKKNRQKSEDNPDEEEVERVDVNEAKSSKKEFRQKGSFRD